MCKIDLSSTLTSYSNISVNAVTISTDGITAIVNSIKDMPIFDGVKGQLMDYCSPLHSTRPYSVSIEKITGIMSKVLENIKQPEMASFYAGWIKFEGLLSICGVRDHFVHNFETFLLGAYLLQVFRQSYIGWVPTDHDLNEIVFGWVLASGFHDLGYAVEKYNDIGKNLAELFGKYGLNSIVDQVKSLELNEKALEELYALNLGPGAHPDKGAINLRLILLDELCSQLQLGSEDADDALHKLGNPLGHGLAGCCLLLKEIIKEKGFSFIGTGSGSIVMASAIAILLHHHGHLKGLKISLKSVPLLAMLIICDEIQEWNRPAPGGGMSYKLESISSKYVGTDLNLVVTISVEAAGLPEDKIVESVKKSLCTKKSKLDSVAGSFWGEKASTSIGIQLNVVRHGKNVDSITIKDLIKGSK